MYSLHVFTPGRRTGCPARPVVMAEVRFDTVSLALGEPNPYLRQALKLALAQRGLTKLTDCYSMEAVEQALGSPLLDVLICDVDLQGGDFCDAIHRMRHHRLGVNPFLLVIATTAKPEAALIRHVIDCGVDDLLLKPVSVEVVQDRLTKLATGRKPFVVTHDYIGPDRRKGDRVGEGVGTPLIDVPNTLFSKAIEGKNPSDLQKLIDEAASSLNTHKMQRYSIQVSFLVRRILQNHGLSEMGDIFTDDCRTLQVVAEDLSRRLRGTVYAHVGELAATLTGLISRFNSQECKPSPVDLELLGKLAQAIRRAFSGEGDAAVAQKISDTVSSFTRRSTT